MTMTMTRTRMIEMRILIMMEETTSMKARNRMTEIA
jgi:hypothetical protein